ncbi:MAG: gamma-glutamyltransferase [Hyphomicrobiales bacterium]|nr:MAG: gamma-glutamyltransferase [Hyphomicrobiales bacterium]
MARNFQMPGRSAAYAAGGMAATSHPLATAAALDMLRQGGNAVDAALAAIAVTTVVEPHMNGIGGDCFAIIAKPDGTLDGLNGSGRAPAALTLERFLERGDTTVNPYHPDAVTVPGAVKAWETLAASHGSRGLDTILSAAISCAEDGFPITPRVAHDWAGLKGLLERDAGATRHYLVDGETPRAGARHKLPALAETLKAIAANGADAFYKGAVAEDIVTTLAAKGGVMSLDDLAAVTADAVTPITTDYRGLTIAEIPPNGQGITALIMLNILERFDLAALDPLGPERFHLEMEAARLAYACRDAYVSDPAAMTETVERLLSDAYTDQLAGMIDPARRLTTVIDEDLVPNADTVYLTVVDENRMAVSLINSVYHGFGSGIVTEKTGIVLQNRGACFSVKEGHPNAVGPSKRPMHTIIPGMALKDGKPVMSFGVMGGAYQPCGQTHVVTNIVDYGMDVQEAIDCARLFWDDEGTLRAETGIPEATVEGLRNRGHDVERASEPHGGGQAIAIDEATGLLVGGSDPRKDGCALGY